MGLMLVGNTGNMAKLRNENSLPIETIAPKVGKIEVEYKDAIINNIVNKELIQIQF